jgi:hypothetical protein
MPPHSVRPVTHPTNDEIAKYDLPHLPEVLRGHARRANFRWPSTALYIPGLSEQWQSFATGVDATLTAEPIRTAVIDAIADQEGTAFAAFYDYYRTTVISSHVENIMKSAAKISNALANSHSAIIIYKKIALEKLYNLHDASVTSWAPSPDDYASTAAELAVARQKAKDEIGRYVNGIDEALAALEATIAAIMRDLQELPRSTFTKPPR